MKRILTIAGSDSGGGAGIQADLKAIAVLGGFGTSAITALTAQNTVGVQGVHPIPVSFIKQQMDSILSDIGTDSAKTGMLATPAIVEAVADRIRHYGVSPLVVDPVMVAKSGDSLLAGDAVEALKTILLPLAFAATPNLPEAAVLCGFPVSDPESMKEAAAKIRDLGPKYVVIKGGHLEGPALDILYDGKSFESYESPRLNKRNTHGTGCTFSAALAVFLAMGLNIQKAVSEAKTFITRAIDSGVDVGRGCGPADPYSHIRAKLERENVVAELKKALKTLTRFPGGKIIPECRSNLVYAVRNAAGYEDVAGVPGRISNIGDEIVACREPDFNATRHVARVVRAAMETSPETRSAMNIRYAPAIVEACKKAGLALASFDRSQEPRDVKEKEGGTLEWGTRQAVKSAEIFPDCVYDEGEKGKEPMVRVLGKNPGEVVAKVVKIFDAWQRPKH